jgi:hypothetical protein
MQFITDGHEKYVYYPGTGIEQFFDLRNDPTEMVNQIDNPNYQDAVERDRGRLIDELEGRPEGFVLNGELTPVGGPTPPYLPGFENPGHEQMIRG